MPQKIDDEAGVEDINRVEGCIVVRECHQKMGHAGSNLSETLLRIAACDCD